MPKYRITSPDGVTYEITAPEGASREDAIARVQSLHMSGNRSATMPSGSVIGPHGQPIYNAETDQTSNFNPADGMGSAAQYVAGLQSKGRDYLLGVEQILGLADTADADAKAKLDAPLAATPAGKAGRITGALIPAIAASPIPGANTVAGSAVIGGALSALEPTGEGDNRVANIGGGALAGALGLLAGRGIGGVIRGVKDFFGPLTQGGREAAAAKLLQEAAQDPQLASQAAQAYKAAIPGVLPTLAQSTLDPGIAALERATGTGGGAEIAARRIANRNVLVDALKGIARTPADVDAAIAARGATTKPLYDAAKAQSVQVDPALAAILDRPAIRSAAGVVDEAAANSGGQSMAGADVLPGSYLHNLKMALDAEIKAGPQKGINAVTADGIGDARDALLTRIEAELPTYGAARQTYADMSEPIGQMQIAQDLHDTLVPALTGDISNSRLAPSAYARALRDASDKLAQKATRFKGARLDDIMDPSQMDTLNGVRADLGREAAALDAPMTSNSATKTSLDYQAMKDDASGVLKRNILARALLSLSSMPQKYTKNAVDRLVTEGLLDPARGSQLLTYQPAPTIKTDFLIEGLRRAGLPLGLGAYDANLGQ